MEKVSSGYEQTETVDRFEQTNQVHLDLREPLTRQRAGIAPRRSSEIVERSSGDEMLDVQFLLPEGKTLDVPAIRVVFSAAPGAEDTAQPEKIVVNRVEPNLAQTEQALRAAAGKFGFDPELAEQFVRNARAAEGQPGGYTTQSFPVRHLGYLLLEMNARAAPDSDQVQINYKFYWGDYGRRLEETLQDLREDASASPTATP